MEHYQDLLFIRGVIVSYEAIRKRRRKRGQAHANQLCRRPRPCDNWHLDAMLLSSGEVRPPSST
jgi:hypothetical protein